MATDFLVVGPLPPPVNGCSLANQVLVEGLSNLITVDYINASTDTVSAKQGKTFSISKALHFLLTYKLFICNNEFEIINLPRLIKEDNYYIAVNELVNGNFKNFIY